MSRFQRLSPAGNSSQFWVVTGALLLVSAVLVLATGTKALDGGKASATFENHEGGSGELVEDPPEFPEGIGPEHVDIARAYGITPQDAQEMLDRQVKQYQAAIRLGEILGNEKFRGSAFSDDFAGSGDFLTIYLRDEASRAEAQEHAKDVGLDLDRIEFVVGELPPPEELPDIRGEKMQAQCNSVGIMDAGRYVAIRNSSSPFENAETNSQCNFPPVPGVCTSGFSVTALYDQRDGVLTAGHCAHMGTRINLGHANQGIPLFTTMSQGTRGLYHNNSSIDMGYYWELVEAVTVKPRVFLTNNLSRNVTEVATNITHYPLNLTVCVKLGAAAWAAGNNHPHAVRCGKIQGSLSAPPGMNNQYSFRFALNNNFSIIGGDSGSPVYVLVGNNAKAMGILHSRSPSNHHIGYANHIFIVPETLGVAVMTLAHGDG